jgi:hypothetical protein
MGVKGVALIIQVASELLTQLRSHSSIGQVAGEGMPQRMEREPTNGTAGSAFLGSSNTLVDPGAN